MKERPIKIRKDSDLNSANVERTNEHYDQLMRELEQRLSAVESTIEDHESRIQTLESA